LDPKTLAMILSLSNISLEKEGNEKEKGEICFFFFYEKMSIHNNSFVARHPRGGVR
jgi:hypothetical protein